MLLHLSTWTILSRLISLIQLEKLQDFTWHMLKQVWIQAVLGFSHFLCPSLEIQHNNILQILTNDKFRILFSYPKHCSPDLLFGQWYWLLWLFSVKMNDSGLALPSPKLSKIHSLDCSCKVDFEWPEQVFYSGTASALQFKLFAFKSEILDFTTKVSSFPSLCT
jgi:hypothetical protein